MSYLTQSYIAQDNVLSRRIIACATLQGVPDPQYWVQQRMWRFATRAGWIDAYKRASGSPAGQDESAVTDSMILAAVKELAAEPDPES